MCERKKEKRGRKGVRRRGKEKEREEEESLESCLFVTYNVVSRKLSRVKESHIYPYPPKWDQIMLFWFAKIICVCVLACSVVSDFLRLHGL